MKIKMITIPFDSERAKRISLGVEEGKIVTRSGKEVRIICYNRKHEVYTIIALVHNTDDNKEYHIFYTKEGKMLQGKETLSDLVLQVPDYTQLKTGDVLVLDDSGYPFIFKGVLGKKYTFYAGLNVENKVIFPTLYDDTWGIGKSVRYATKEETQKLINALKNDGDILTVDYLKKFFNIEVFKPFDKVLVRDNTNWRAAFFSHIDYANQVFITTGGLVYRECLPYNEETKHLIGTDKNYIK